MTGMTGSGQAASGEGTTVARHVVGALRFPDRAAVIERTREELSAVALSTQRRMIESADRATIGPGQALGTPRRASAVAR